MAKNYTYDNMSRLATIAGLGKSAAYSRLSESNRLNTVSFGLIPHLYRAYGPALARDPINEQGCNFVGNNPVTRWDRLGQWSALSVVSGILGVISGIGIIGLITASTPAIAAVTLVATGVMGIGIGLSEIIEGFTDRNEYSESIASTMGFEPASGRYTYRGIEFVSTIFSFKGSLKNLKIIFKGERHIVYY